jgi:hypothetical protein
VRALDFSRVFNPPNDMSLEILKRARKNCEIWYRTDVQPCSNKYLLVPTLRYPSNSNATKFAYHSS